MMKSDDVHMEREVSGSGGCMQTGCYLHMDIHTENSIPHFHYIDKNFFINPASSNKKFFHESIFKLIKTFFISPASIYATLFIKVGGKSPGGKSPRLVMDHDIVITTYLHSIIYFIWDGTTFLDLQISFF